MKKMFLFASALSLLTACKDNSGTTVESDSKKDSTSVESKEERNKEIVLRSIEAFRKGNVEDVLKDATPDVVEYGDGSMPIVKGVDSIKAGIQMWRSSFSEYKVDNLKAFADGDHVLVYGEWSGTFKTDFMGMKTNGKSFKIHDVDIFKLNDEGKIVEHRAVQSFNTVFNEMGLHVPKMK